MSDLTGGLENIYIYFYFATVCKELNVSPHPYKVPPFSTHALSHRLGKFHPSGFISGVVIIKIEGKYCINGRLKESTIRGMGDFLLKN